MLCRVGVDLVWAALSEPLGSRVSRFGLSIPQMCVRHGDHDRLGDAGGNEVHVGIFPSGLVSDA